MKRVGKIVAVSAALVTVLVVISRAQEQERGGPVWESWQLNRRDVQDTFGGVPEEILKLQDLTKAKPPTMDVAIEIALEAAQKAAHPLTDRHFHNKRRLVVPDEFKTIQSAIDAAERGDVVVVKQGIYYELIVMKDGVKLVSDSAGGGDKLVTVEGARLRLPLRTMRTVIDGSKAKTSHHGMIDFNPGVGRNTVVDGFTIQNLPKQDHHIPGHAHALNVRGASPVIVNCYVRKNGSTGIGSHVVYADQESKISERDFRWANVKHKAEAVIYHNIVRENLGLGIGCNHFSAPHILGNEILLNDDTELGEKPSPGMGIKHGAAPTIIGNIIHDHPGGGILSKVGDPQGEYHVDRPTHPTVVKNVVYGNGKLRPAISSRGGGSKAMPVRFIGNFVYDAGAVGMSLSKGAVGILEENIVSGSGAPGISINDATALKFNRNRVTRARAPGFVIINGSRILEMIGNSAHSNRGPRFILRGSTIANPTQRTPLDVGQ
jgi:hypothetical protein